MRSRRTYRSENRYGYPVVARSTFVITVVLFLIATGLLAALAMNSFSEMRTAEDYASSIQASFDDRNKALAGRENDLSSNINALNEKYYNDKLTELLGADKLTEMGKAVWSYKLKGNGNDLWDGPISTAVKDITITLEETKDTTSVLPADIIKKGSVKENDSPESLKKHVTITSSVNYMAAVEEEENTIKINYTFKDVPSGSVIRFQFSDALTERLKFKSNFIELTVK